MKRGPRIDRENELKLLLQVASGDHYSRIALIDACSGMGKSELLREFIARCQSEREIVFVDFKSGGLSLADVLFHICDTIGKKHFPHLAEAVRCIVQPTVIQISQNIMLGQNNISIALSAPDEQTRAARRADLTAALIDDLRALGQQVLIFDVYEKCDPGLQAWFAGVFLPAAHRSPHLSVIIAGQQVPEQTPMWECEHLLLGGIPAEDWEIYAHAVGAAVSLDFIRGICEAFEHCCLKIAEMLSGYGGRS